ncbi:MAG TPA: right-handed parallel beta-helix repeat-containing protein, partial [Opitutaceae bacterium]|nr:right-handed parallel beta-helix repeat-containing protein [Opitutaceae bacterium]
AAIGTAAGAGGGTVTLPAGTYLSFSIRLKSNITLHLEAGATLLAATPAIGFGGYDPAEPNDWGDKLQYQDFGHSHWHNSLIWGEDLENIAITGPGLIDGKGLARNASYQSSRGATGPDGTVARGESASVALGADVGAGETPPPDLGNKAIGLKACRNVALRDFSVLNGGHFALLATGVDGLAIENLHIDTNRDGLDIDGCRDVRITGCRVNSPNDDAIVLKSSYALGRPSPCDNITITHCTVSGFDVGTMLDGTFGRTTMHAPDRDGPTGRIKLGTESNGPFRNITIADCTFDRSRGLAIESVDGAIIEDITIRNIAMRELANPPVFICLGNRARGPEGTSVGAIRRVNISGINADDADSRYSAVLIAGLPAHPIEDVTLADIRVAARGRITLEQVSQQPNELVNSFFLRNDEPGVTGPRDPFAVPLRERAYPEPSMFGLLPASAIYARHVRELSVRDASIDFASPDDRPLVVLDNVGQASFENFNASRPRGDAFVLRRVAHFDVVRCPGVADTHQDGVENFKL